MQELVKGNFSTTMHLVALNPDISHGAIALSADGKVKFFQQQPIGDVQATTMELTYDANFHCPPGADDQHGVEWIAKLFNVALMLNALELFVVVDEYRLRKREGFPQQDIHLQAYARLNEKHILSKIIGGGVSASSLDALANEEEEIVSYVAAQVGIQPDPFDMGCSLFPFDCMCVCHAGGGPQTFDSLPSMWQGFGPCGGHASYDQ